MLQRQLQGRQGRARQYPSVYVNTWQYAQFSSERYLGASILNAVTNAIAKQHPGVTGEQFDRLKQYAGKAFSFLSNVANQAVANQIGIDVGKAASDSLSGTGSVGGFDELADLIENYKEAFEQVVNRVIPSDDGSKLVIMIDDLDRVRPSRALELLEAVKIFLDVPRCVFVLAVDYSVIKQGVREKLGTDTENVYGKSYFDKIIQVPFNMPVSAYQIDRYVMSLLGWKYEGNYYAKNDDYGAKQYFLTIYRAQSLGEDEAKFFTNIVRVTTGPNPRSIKRIINYAFLLKTVYEKNRKNSTFDIQAAKILFSLAALQLEWPEIFSLIALKPVPQTIAKMEQWDYISNLPELTPIFRRAEDVERLKSNISAFFDEFLRIIDVNEDGKISAEEFRPVWQMMVDTNLTSAPLEDNEEAWNTLQKRVRENLGRSNWDAEAILSCLSDFKKSELNNPFHFRLIEAGARFHNLVWDGKQIGSIVSTGGEPLQVYLVPEVEEFGEVASRHPELMKKADFGHYGVGETWFDARFLAAVGDEAERIALVDEVVETLLNLVSAR